MTDGRTLYATLLGITEPWGVELVEMKQEAGEVHVTVALPANTRWVCPECLAAAPIHDHQDRTWRHLDTCQFKTFVHARVPRLNCPTHGIRQLRVAWAEPGSRFTALFEALAIDWLKQASLSAVAKQLRISWDEADGIMGRAVERGLARRQLEPPRYVGVDETSFQRRREYVTEAEKKIVFDKFHVAQHLGKAVDEVRKREHRERMAEGDPILKGTKYDWLRSPKGRSWSEARAFNLLREIVTRV